jgi:hypothetical protein
VSIDPTCELCCQRRSVILAFIIHAVLVTRSLAVVNGLVLSAGICFHFGNALTKRNARCRSSRIYLHKSNKDPTATCHYAVSVLSISM